MPKPIAQTVGRRKEAVARVRLRDGAGRVVLNGRALEDFFPTMAIRMRVMEPMQVTSDPEQISTSTPPSRAAGSTARPMPFASASPGP